MDAELVKIISAALVSQSTNFKTAPIHFPSLPSTCTVWDHLEEILFAVLLVVEVDLIVVIVFGP